MPSLSALLTFSAGTINHGRMKTALLVGAIKYDLNTHREGPPGNASPSQPGREWHKKSLGTTFARWFPYQEQLDIVISLAPLGQLTSSAPGEGIW